MKDNTAIELQSPVQETGLESVLKPGSDNNGYPRPITHRIELELFPGFPFSWLSDSIFISVAYGLSKCHSGQPIFSCFIPHNKNQKPVKTIYQIRR